MKKHAVRKGEESSTTVEKLVGLIFILTVFLVGGVVFCSFTSSANKEVNVRTCQSSLLLTKAVAQKNPACTVGSLTPFNLECPRQFLSIKDNVVNKNGKDVTSTYSNKCPSGEASCLQENVLASEMAFCWNMFFKGEEPVLQQVEKSDLISDSGTEVACFICSEVVIDKPNSDFVKFLKEKTMDTEKMTYYNYLANNSKAICGRDSTCNGWGFSGIGSGNCWDSMRKGVNDKPTLDTKLEPGKYVVAFVRRGVGSCAGEDAKSPTWKRGNCLVNTVQLIPSSKIGSYCNYVLT